MDYLTKCSLDEIRNMTDKQAEANDIHDQIVEESDKVQTDNFDKTRLNDILSQFIRYGKRSLSISYPNTTVMSVNRIASLAIKHKLNAYVRIVKGVPILDIDCF